MSRTRILCVDDHAFLVEGLKTRIEAEFGFEFAGHVDRADRLDQAVREHRPDIVLLDIEMPGMDAFEALRELMRNHPKLRVVILSAYVRDHYIDEAYKAGAWGYLTKADSPDEIIKAVEKVARGQMAASAVVRERMQAGPAGRGQARPEEVRSKLDLITKREMEILRMIAKGMSRTAIAEQIHRSPMTVDNHRKSIMKKLGINDRGELVRYAIAEGLVEV